MRLGLEFAATQTDACRCRLEYAFRVFCVIYGHKPIVPATHHETADAWITYSSVVPNGKGRRSIRLTNAYVPRRPTLPAPPPHIFEADGHKTALIYEPAHRREPDWLGEIFDWISCADEYSVTARDSVGRIPLAASYVGRHGLDCRVPYAAIAMHCLQAAICRQVPASSPLPKPPKFGGHAIVNTHDIDFLPTSRPATIRRLGKNAAISLLSYRAPRLALRQASMALRCALGRSNATDQIDWLAHEETDRGLGASYYFIAAQCHTRDANYTIGEPKVVKLMRALTSMGFEVGVHGSYTSLEQQNQLLFEFEQMRELGFDVSGGRQHWLRFTLDRLIPAVQNVNARYDTSLGWSNCSGFRAGACFPFPPYDFGRERAASFLEIPLVYMDKCLLHCGRLAGEWKDDVQQVVAASRRYGWGGIALLWHNTAFESVQFPAEVGQAFWALADRRVERNDVWLSATEFERAVRSRYTEAGLLQ